MDGKGLRNTAAYILGVVGTALKGVIFALCCVLVALVGVPLVLLLFVAHVAKEAAKSLRRALPLLLALLMIPLLSGCRTHGHVVESGRQDSVSVLVRETVRAVPDTVDVYLPPQTVERLTPDTFSLLETDFAISEARVTEGMLMHTLRTKQQAFKAAVQRLVVTRDSVVYRDREVVKTEEVKAKLHWWQKAWLVLPLPLLLVIYLLGKRYRRLRKKYC
ncbi:MAG: hypothetical protein LUI09_03280 [Prevotellaceae bacterium]|nr:hypothetical protein [Prevotellaceae bacterium]